MSLRWLGDATRPCGTLRKFMHRVRNQKRILRQMLQSYRLVSAVYPPVISQNSVEYVHFEILNESLLGIGFQNFPGFLLHLRATYGSLCTGYEIRREF